MSALQKIDNQKMTFEQIYSMAEKLIKAGDFVPHYFKGNPSALAAAILKGRELGMQPMASINGLQVVRGKIGVSYDVAVGLLRKHGYLINWLKTDSQEATIKLVRRETGEEMTLTFTMEDARRAKLTGHPDSNWSKYPALMLRTKAIHHAARSFAGEVFAGIYSMDELQEVKENGVKEYKVGTNGIKELLSKNKSQEEDRELSIDFYGAFVARINSSKNIADLMQARDEIKNCNELTEDEKEKLREKWKEKNAELKQKGENNEH